MMSLLLSDQYEQKETSALAHQRSKIVLSLQDTAQIDRTASAQIYDAQAT